MIVNLHERTTLRGKLDHTAHVVTDVVVLGAVSRNGRRYTPAALESAARTFEGKRVYLNHGKRGQGRDVRDYVGYLSGLHVQGDKVRANRLVVANRQHWPIVASVEQHPEAFGLSIDGEGKTTSNGKEVTEVTAGHSVDIVSDPATSAGLFEQHDGSHRTPLRNPDPDREREREYWSLLDACNQTRDGGLVVQERPVSHDPLPDDETASLLAALQGQA